MAPATQSSPANAARILGRCLGGRSRDYNSTTDSGLAQVFGISDTPINDKKIEDGRHGFSSYHPGGSFFVFADGHVEFIAEDIEFNQTGTARR